MALHEEMLPCEGLWYHAIYKGQHGIESNLLLAPGGGRCGLPTEGRITCGVDESSENAILPERCELVRAI